MKAFLYQLINSAKIQLDKVKEQILRTKIDENMQKFNRLTNVSDMINNNNNNNEKKKKKELI